MTTSKSKSRWVGILVVVVGSGGPVLSLVDLGDVYMTFFLPTREAGQLALGAEARIGLDAWPQFVIPARISFVANVAQFTPKTVETASERKKLEHFKKNCSRYV